MIWKSFTKAETTGTNVRHDCYKGRWVGGKVLPENVFPIPGNIMQNTILRMVAEKGHDVGNISIYWFVQHVSGKFGPCLEGMFLGGRGFAASRTAHRKAPDMCTHPAGSHYQATALNKILKGIHLKWYQHSTLNASKIFDWLKHYFMKYKLKANLSFIYTVFVLDIIMHGRII